MCVVCFVKALVHLFKIYLTANYTYNFRGWPVDLRWDDVHAATAGVHSGHRGTDAPGSRGGHVAAAGRGAGRRRAGAAVLRGASCSKSVSCPASSPATCWPTQWAAGSCTLAPCS